LDSAGFGGIALADAEYLVIHDNQIEGNGHNHLEAVCGIFVLHAEGIDISRNRILHNGSKTGQPSNLAKDGRRGGINIVYGVANANLGQSNEIYAQLITFSGIKNGDFASGPGGPDVTDDVISLPQPGLDDARIGQYLANGNVLFANNQCVLDLSEKGVSTALT